MDPNKSLPTASELKGFGSREWLAGLMDPDRIATLHYFGGTKFKNGKMVKFVKKDVPAYTPEQKAGLKKVIAAVSAGDRHALGLLYTRHADTLRAVAASSC